MCGLRASPQRELTPHFAVDVVVLRRDPAASLKSRIELGHFCGRSKRSDWLLFPLDHELRVNITHKSQDDGSDGDRPSADGADADGFEALIAYAEYTEASIRYLQRVFLLILIGLTAALVRANVERVAVALVHLSVQETQYSSKV